MRVLCKAANHKYQQRLFFNRSAPRKTGVTNKWLVAGVSTDMDLEMRLLEETLVTARNLTFVFLLFLLPWLSLVILWANRRGTCFVPDSSVARNEVVTVVVCFWA